MGDIGVNILEEVSNYLVLGVLLFVTRCCMIQRGLSGAKTRSGMHCCNIPIAYKQISAGGLTSLITSHYSLDQNSIFTSIYRVKKVVLRLLGSNCSIRLSKLNSFCLSTKDRNFRSPGGYAPRQIGTHHIYFEVTPYIEGDVGFIGFREGP